VKVFKDQDDRRSGGQALEKRSPGAEELLGADRGLDAKESEEGRLDPAALLGIRDVSRESFGDSGTGRRFVVGLHEPAPLADHLAKRPEADPITVGWAPSVVPPDTLDQSVEVLGELPGEARLANSRRTNDRDKAGPLLAGRGVKQILEEAQFLVASNKGSLKGLGPLAAATFRDHAHGAPGGNRRGLSLEVRLACFLEGDRAAGSPLGRLTDQDGARLGNALESGCGVDEVAGDHALVEGPDCHRGLASEDSRSRLDRRSEGADGVDELERRPDRALGVIFVGDRGTPDGHDRVADELLDRPAVAGDHLGCEVEVAGEQLPCVLGVAALGECREPDEVCEEDGHEAPFGDRGSRWRCTERHGTRRRDRGRRTRSQRRPADAAELLACLVGRAAGRAARGQRRAAFAAEPAAGPILRPALRADHRMPPPACGSEGTAGRRLPTGAQSVVPSMSWRAGSGASPARP
jgi:hypothetical protein